MNSDWIEHNVDQGTPEWFRCRERKFTASAAPDCLADEKTLKITVAELTQYLGDRADILKKPKRPDLIALLSQEEIDELSVFSDSRESAINNWVDRVLGGNDDCPEFDTFWTKRGKRLEGEAALAYSFITDNEIEEVGFFSKGFLGISPDRLVNMREGGLEIKSLSGPAHIKILRTREIPSEYIPQINFYLQTGLEWVDFIAYHPKFPPFIKRVYRTDYTERQAQGLGLAESKLISLAKQLEIKL